MRGMPCRRTIMPASWKSGSRHSSRSSGSSWRKWGSSRPEQTRRRRAPLMSRTRFLSVKRTRQSALDPARATHHFGTAEVDSRHFQPALERAPRDRRRRTAGGDAGQRSDGDEGSRRGKVKSHVSTYERWVRARPCAGSESPAEFLEAHCGRMLPGAPPRGLVAVVDFAR